MDGWNGEICSILVVPHSFPHPLRITIPLIRSDRSRALACLSVLIAVNVSHSQMIYIKIAIVCEQSILN